MKSRRRFDPAAEKPIHWIGSSLDDLARLPLEVKRVVGYALRLAQQHEPHENAKPMHGRFTGVMEIVANDRSNRTFRVMYTAKLKGVVYVLHAFNKKAPRGSETPRQELDLLDQRLRMANQDYKERYGSNETRS